MGVVNKVCMFDKDVMFLVIFGLRGARHEYNAVRSLKCAHRIRSIISKLPGVITISCGVTVGTTYCGVVGHPLRQEYTIIGAPVNKAARLMVYYPNTVSCDQATFFNSGLSTVHFRQLESKTLKGLGKVTGIYEYLEGQGLAEMTNLHLPVLLGMQAEVESFRELLAGQKGFPAGIIYSGEVGIGKTRLLTELYILCVDSHLRPVSLTLNASQLKKPYIALRYLYREIFELASDTHISSVANKIESLYKDTDLEMFVSLLNPVFNLDLPSRLPKNHEFTELDLAAMQKRLLARLVELTAINLAIFIDNMDYCDPKTVEMIQSFLTKGNCLVVMSCNRARSVKVTRWFPNCACVELENLEESLLPALACQILNVRAIPRTVHLLICKHAEASPGWCQRYLQSLIDSKAIQVVKMQRKDLDKLDNMIVPDYNLLIRRLIGQEVTTKRVISVQLPSLQETFDSEVDVCILESSDAIDETVPASIEAIIMSAFDSLQPFEQLLLKCAAVIGDIFPRDFLVAMLQNKSKNMVAVATKRLFEMHILCCYNEMQREKSQSIDSRINETGLTVDPVCSCPYIESNHDLLREKDELKLPTFAFCQEIAFTLPMFRHKTYDLLPLNQRQMFHTRAAKYLESLLKSGSVVDDIGQSDFKFVDICTAFTYRPLIYDQLIRHTHNGVLPVKEVHCMIEYAQYSILRNSPRRALTHLEKVIDLVQMEGDLPMARVLALKSVHAILSSRGANLADLFIALANLLDVTCLLGLFSYCDRILEKGQSILNMRVKNMHNTDFVAEEIAIGKFISTAFKVKLLEGKLVPAYELGKAAELKAEECEAEAALLWNRCFCILLAIHLKKIDQAVYYLEKLRNEGKEMSSTCYFIFSTYLILYTGLIEESPHRALEEVHRSLIDLERPLAIVLAVFFIRRDEMYRYKFIEHILSTEEVTMSNVFFEIMLLEFFIIRMVRKNDSRRWDKKHMARELSHIASFCITLWNVIKARVIFLLPRAGHVKRMRCSAAGWNTRHGSDMSTGRKLRVCSTIRCLCPENHSVSA
ncbi:adenylate cyclase type 10 isoform X2 [Nilaparvata lugens]|uniref:adenylate cyclase type 10 isoform X2 n=1 Tax=Nilaparvata lugens TaxID=108931 RepID=UPI00193E5661|nr:adenylate cyclase type 10 isoform X2 [Nilaparvata lugens]